MVLILSLGPGTGDRGPVALMDLDLCCSVSLETEQNRTVDDDYISC